MDEKPKLTFNEKDYSSNDGMLTTIWGPTQWHCLHTMSFNYPTSPTYQEKIKYRNYILHLPFVLPCGKCRKNLRTNFKKMPLLMKHMKSRDTFSRYIYDLHELVNDMLGKESGLSYTQVRDRYEHFRSRCSIEQKEKEKEAKEKEVKEKGKKEDGCTTPLAGSKKTKCVLRIVPVTDKCRTFQTNHRLTRKKRI